MQTWDIEYTNIKWVSSTCTLAPFPGCAFCFQKKYSDLAPQPPFPPLLSPQPNSLRLPRCPPHLPSPHFCLLFVSLAEFIKWLCTQLEVSPLFPAPPPVSSLISSWNPPGQGGGLFLSFCLWRMCLYLSDKCLQAEQRSAGICFWRRERRLEGEKFFFKSISPLGNCSS